MNFIYYTVHLNTRDEGMQNSENLGDVFGPLGVFCLISLLKSTISKASPTLLSNMEHVWRFMP